MSRLFHLSFLDTNDRPFKCDQCDMTFKTDFSLYSHKKQHIEHKFKCDLCAKGFQQKNHLEAHIEQKHSGKEGAKASKRKRQTTTAKATKSKAEKTESKKSRKNSVKDDQESENDEADEDVEEEEEEESEVDSEEIESDIDSMDDDVSIDDDDEDDDFDEEEDNSEDSLDENDIDPNTTPMVSTTKSGRKVTKVRHFRADENELARTANSGGSLGSKRSSNFKSPADFLSIHLTEGDKRGAVDDLLSDEDFSSGEDEDGLQEFLSRRRRIQAAISGIESRGAVLKEGSVNSNPSLSANGNASTSVQDSCSLPPSEIELQQESLGAREIAPLQDELLVTADILKSEPIDHADPYAEEMVKEGHSLVDDDISLSHQGDGTVENALEERLYPEPPEPSIYQQDQHTLTQASNEESIQSPYSSTVAFIRGQGVPNLQDLRSPETTLQMDSNQ